MTAKTRNPLASGLLEVAEHLAQIRSRRIVEQAAFRRAISSAYYAAFHTLCQICAEGLGLWTSAPDDLEPIYRNLEHSKAREVLSSAKARALHEDIERIGDVLLELRRLRENADYSQPGRFGATQRLLTRSETQTLIALAEGAVLLLDGLPLDARRRLAVMLTVRSSRR
ncbi:hypothetical protein [uncultured Methylobacterium sp.]|uniref:hypothetical protein n=1 Tax=uncultured Methylobacterium sp. TaxID=157278 RepID=UPI0035C9BFF4